ncbi:MAG: BMP family ABC transporter substrate-binding protein [Candidatus Rokuibacteriota bacterium]|nr:MAG: BMP family ABC transporter substrate-binding protein [Candidatus Rokubacteria bacterium]
MNARAIVTTLVTALLVCTGVAPAQPKLIVGILHVGSITDAGYNQAHADGIQAMKRNLPEVEVIEVENVPEGADAERVMESMIKRGARLIIPASFGYLEPALRVAQRYPEVKFAHPGGYKRVPNLTTYWASTPEGFYLLGMAAGKVTKTNKIGYVVALPISFFLANINAFELGARSVNPKAETRLVFTGTFLDPAKEATAATALLDQGADVLGVIVDSPITVVQTAEKRGAYSVGYHYLGAQKFAPNGWISGIAFTWGNLYTRFARQVLDGSFKSENILGSLGDDLLAIAPFGPAVPADAASLVNAKRQEFIGGRAHPFQGPLKDNTGVERVKAGEVFPLTDLGKMNWLVEGVVGQPR